MPIDAVARQDLRDAIARARELRRSTARPPVTEKEVLCKTCSLAPVCLPEEERLVSLDTHPEGETDSTRRAERTPPSLFPPNRDRHTVHVVSYKAYVSRSRDTLKIKTEDETQTVSAEQVDAVVIHGFGQVTTQAI